jgi:hypothetical protein
MTTINLPLFSGLLATSTAAQVAAPEEMPAKMPSSLANLRAVAPAFSLVTWIISSTASGLYTSGTNPAPMPWILCDPGLPPDNTGEAMAPPQ